MNHESSGEVVDLEEVVRLHESLVGQPERVGDRIRLLRILRDRDVNTARWSAELAACEEDYKAALVSELRHLATRIGPVAEEDAHRAEVIHALLASPAWEEPLSGDDILCAQSLLEQVGRARADAIIDELLPRLESAREDGAWERARELADELEPHWRRAGRDLQSVGSQAFVRCRRWVDEQLSVRVAARARETAIESVRVATRFPLSWSMAGLIRNRDRLEAALNQMVLAQGISESIEAAAVTADARVARRSINFRIRLLAGIVAASICLMLLVATFTLGLVRQAWIRYRIITETRATLLGHARSHRLPAAREAWRQASHSYPWISHHPLRIEVESLLEQLDQEVGRDQADLAALVDKAADRLRGPCVDAVAALRQACSEESSSARDFETVRKRCDQVVADMTAAVADAVARLVEIEARWGKQVTPAALTLHEVRQGAKSLASEAASMVEQAHAAWFQQMRERLRRLEQASEPIGADVRTEMQEIQELIAEAQAIGRRVPNDVRQTLAALEARFHSEARLALVRRKLDVASRAGSDAFMRAVKSEANSGEDTVTTGLQRVLRAAPAIVAAEAWAHVAREWHADLNFDEAQAACWRRAIDAASKATMRPAADQGIMADVERVRDLLVERAGSPIGEILEPLSSYLGTRVMQPGSLLVVDGKRRFYTTEDAHGKRFIDEDTLARRGGFAAAETRAAAHLALARRMRESITEITRGRIDPDEGITRLLRQCVDESLVGETDRLLLCRLVRSVVEVAEQRQLFAPAKTDLEAIEVRIRSRLGKQPRWIDSDQWSGMPVWRKALQTAQDVLPSHGEIEKIIAVYESRRRTLGCRPEFCQPLDFAGWVDASSGTCVIRLRPDLARHATGLLYAVRLRGDAEWTLEEVGEVSDAEAVLKPNVRLDYGQPLHAVWR